MGLGSSLRLSLPEFEERRRRWRETLGDQTRANPETVEFVLDAMESQLDRARTAISDLDRKASLVIPGVGVFAGVVGTNVNRDVLGNPVMAFLLAAVLIFAGSSVVFALLCLAPQWAMSDGPRPERIVSVLSDEPLGVRVAVVNALGFAVSTTEEVANIKAFWLGGSLRIGAAGVGQLLVFIGLGGLR